LRKKHISVFFMLLILSLMSVEIVQAQTLMKPSDDTHVDSTIPESVLGAEKYLDVESYGSASSPTQQVVWLKFDLSSLPSGIVIKEATLQVMAWYVGGEYDVSAYYSSDSSWTEETLAYSNMPSYDAEPVDTVKVHKIMIEEWFSWNVAEAVQKASDSGTQTLTIVLNEPTLNSQNSVYFYSKETPSLTIDPSPTLSVSWSYGSSATQNPTAIPSSLPTETPIVSSLPTQQTGSPNPTSVIEGSQETGSWTVWGVPTGVVAVIAIIVVGYVLMKRRGIRSPEQVLPPPPPSDP
jgi:hypothetical protein